MNSNSVTGFSFKRSDFPSDFIFGTATSAYQIEGQAYGGAGVSHWDSFAATPGNVYRQQNGAVACDHYHRYQEDLALVAKAGLDAYRFSTAWSRVQPEGAGTVNQEGLDFYDRLVDATLEQNLKPCLTLYHWELPAALADQGGWQNREISNWFAEYSELVLRRLGDRIFSVAPINEPWCVTWLSHYLGAHAPGVRNIRAATRAMHHVLLAQGRALEIARTLNAGQQGVVFNFEYAEPVSESAENKKASQLYDGIYNRWFLEAVCQGAYPQDVLEYLEPHLPDNWEQDFKTIAAPLDWIGVNYYTRKLIGADPELPLPAVQEHVGDLPQTSMGWEIYPEGLFEILRRVSESSGYKVPIYITENGMSADDQLLNGEINDQHRIDYINAHMAEVHRAISEGIPIAGYFIWSLMDNYEWALGYDKRFGLVHVDFENLQRTPKRSWYALAEALSK